MVVVVGGDPEIQQFVRKMERESVSSEGKDRFRFVTHKPDLELETNEFHHINAQMHAPLLLLTDPDPSV